MFWPYCPKNPNFKFQFQPLSSKIGRGKNLARPIELNIGRNCTGGNYPITGQLPNYGGKLSGGNYAGGNFPSSNFAGGNRLGAIVLVFVKCYMKTN